MKDYSSYQTQDLVRDPYFRQSVLFPDAESSAFWTTWKAGDPDRETYYREARLLVIGLEKRYKDTLSDGEIRRRVARITDRLPTTDRPGVPSRRWWERHWWKAAAVLFLAMLFIARERMGQTQSREKTTSASLPQERTVEPAPLLTRANRTKADQTIVLDDNTVVTLSPGSSIVFPARFGNAERPVTLVGDAFFEVTPNPSKPFLVFAGETVTKVLGTSFRVRAFQKDSFVKVSVKTGKVSVFRSEEFGAAGRDGVLLTPNEQVLFNRTDEKIKKSSVVRPGEIAKTTDAIEFIFDDTPVTEVFRQLEQQYGMEIEFDTRAFNSCPITTSFKDESLIERINSICQAVGASYTPSGGKIIITGTGCNNL